MTDDAKQEREAVLLPCPLCNAPADIIFNKVGGAFSSGMETPQPSAECTSCKLRTPIFRCDDWPSGRKSGTPTQKEAVAAVTALWNNRQPQTDALKIALWHLERIRDVEDIDPVWTAMSALAAIDAALKESK